MALSRRLSRKIQRFRIFSAVIVTSITLISFQNCAPLPEVDCEGTDCSSQQTSGSSTQGSSSTSTQVSTSSSGGGGIAVGSGSSSGSTSTGTSSGGNSFSVGSYTTSGSTTSGTTFTNTQIGASDSSFKITQQPAGLKVNEDGEILLEILISGGTAPYSYQWYLNSKAITGGIGNYAYYRTTADSWLKEGSYYVIVKDAKGQSLQSTLARVTITEPAIGCKAGKYFTFTNPTYDVGYQYFTEYFDGPRGKFLLHQSYDTYNMLFPYPSYSKLSYFNVPQNLAYLGKTWISCRTNIPRIHTPAVNPGYEEYYDRYADTSEWVYQGTVTFECHNLKLKFVSNTCKWVRR